MAGEGIAGIHEFLQLLAGTGNVRLLGCRLAAATFAVDDSELIPEATGHRRLVMVLECKRVQV